MNILDSLKDQLGDGLAGQLGDILGEPEQKTKGAMDAMLGTILGSVLGKASTPKGAEELSRELDDHDGGILDSLGGMFGGDDQKKLAESGSGILGSLLGDKLGGVGSLLAKLSGMKSASALSMLSMLAPLVMSFLGKMKKSQGLDANGLASMLMSQKDNIAGTLPEGMADTMGLKSSLFDKGADSVRRAGSSAAHTASRATTQAAPAGSALWKVLLPALIIGTLGYLGYRQFSGAGNTAGRDATEQTAPADDKKLELPGMPALPDIPGLGDMGNDLTASFANAQGALTDIKDEATAKDAVTKLEGITEKIGGMAGGFENLPEAAKTGLSSHITSKLLPSLMAAVDKAKEIPGVGAIIEPAIQALMEKLKAFTG